jgi:hypothetical protein
VTQPAEPTPGAAAQPAPAPGAPAPTTPSGQDPNEPVDVAALPANVQHLITSLRNEASASRTSAKTRAAEHARAEILSQIGSALGLGEDATPDPARLAEQLQQTRTDAASARLELDVYRTAHRLGADADRLLDSRRFAEEVDQLDPDKPFGPQIEALIKQWVERDSCLRQQPPPDPYRPVESLKPGALPAGETGQFDMNEFMRRHSARR